MEFEYLKTTETYIATNVQFPCEVVIVKKGIGEYQTTVFTDEGSSPVIGTFPTITEAIRFAEVLVPFEYNLGAA